MISPIDVPPKSRRPNHVAIIMDGNGRWAVDRGLSRLDGHRKGAEVVRDITTFARELELEHLTLFSFSTENWSRPAVEVAGLMQLLEDYCRDERDTLMNNEIRLKLIGGHERLPSSTRKSLQALLNETEHNTKMTLTLAIDYGGREDIARAVRKIASEVQAGSLALDAIDEALVCNRLDTASTPDPDLLMRTSGEMRLSNFLLWQTAYSEFYFTDVRWPDFTRADFVLGLQEFARRQRRFGKTAEQIDAI